MSSDETRERILDAAQELFAAKGFAGTSVREITRLAEVNVAAIHYHFGTKEAVLRGVTDRIVGPLNPRTGLRPVPTERRGWNRSIEN